MRVGPIVGVPELGSFELGIKQLGSTHVCKGNGLFVGSFGCRPIVMFKNVGSGDSLNVYGDYT